MSVSASGLRDEIIALFPGGWSWQPGGYNYAYLDALCQGFTAMWAAGVMTPGLGPPPIPPPTYPHTHTITSLIPSLMSTPVAVLGYTGAATAFATAIAAQVSSFLISTTVLDVQDGVVTHVHGFTFDSDAALKSAIMGAVAVAGVAIDPFVTALATGIIDHLMANAGMTPASGDEHLHTLT